MYRVRADALVCPVERSSTAFSIVAPALQFSSPPPCFSPQTLQAVGEAELSTRCLTGLTVRRKANIAFKSSSFKLRYTITGIIELSFRAFTDPVCITSRNNASS